MSEHFYDPDEPERDPKPDRDDGLPDMSFLDEACCLTGESSRGRYHGPNCPLYSDETSVAAVAARKAFGPD